MTLWIAALVALFIWWFATGAILLAVKFADRLGGRAGFWMTFAGLPLLGAGAYGAQVSATDTTALGVYVAFFSALAIWAWIELAFLTGVITGPVAAPLPAGLSGSDRFSLALGTIAYHEALLVIALIALGLGLGLADNPFAFWTFAVLFFARVSAKLNLFLGVSRIHTEFLPSALSHLPTYFRRAQMNWLFPLSVSALTFAAACWLERLYTAQTQADQIGFALLTALTALATLEHWVMVLPIPDERLWRWMLPAPQPQKNQKTQGGHNGL
ncbi:MAG: putative photosynthetic complex assembly protein PuhE [Pseudomonadota bacterium]